MPRQVACHTRAFRPLRVLRFVVAITAPEFIKPLMAALAD